MATIYRIIVEQGKGGGDGEGRTPRAKSSKTPSKKGKNISIFSSNRGGVEHNRKMRAINPVLNKATNGYWEKGMRLGRAGIGLARNVSESGAKGLFAGPALAIIVSFMLITLMKLQNRERQKAQELNSQNYKMLENGVGAIHSAYEVDVNTWTGRQTYNQNK